MYTTIKMQLFMFFFWGGGMETFPRDFFPQIPRIKVARLSTQTLGKGTVAWLGRPILPLFW